MSKPYGPVSYAFDQWDYERTVTLVGGYTCALSNKELNEWHVLLFVSVAFIRLVSLRRELDTLELRQTGSGSAEDFSDLIRAVHDKKISTERDLFYEGKVWFEVSVVPAREKRRAEELTERDDKREADRMARETTITQTETKEGTDDAQ